MIRLFLSIFIDNVGYWNHFFIYYAGISLKIIVLSEKRRKKNLIFKWLIIIFITQLRMDLKSHDHNLQKYVFSNYEKGILLIFKSCWYF